MNKLVCAFVLCAATACSQIDPNILLQSKPVQIETPLDAQTKAQNLRNLRNQGQIQREQIEAQQLQNQQAQQQLDSTKRLNDASAGARTPGANGAPPSQLEAQQAADLFTGGFVNGRYWQALGTSGQATFVLGVRDTAADIDMLLILLGSQAGGARNLARPFAAPGFSANEIAREITKLYDEPANVRIPVAFIETTATGVLKGDSAAKTEADLEQMRTGLSSVQ